MKTWKPSKTDRKEFAEKMQDAEFAKAYNERKEKRANNRRKTSSFDYFTAGGFYTPTKAQHDAAFKMASETTDATLKVICSEVMSGYSSNVKVHHDHIHIINEYIRNNQTL
ncbi:MAG: hypothetical protein AB9842_08205 [Bacteroidales bacterium]